MQPSFLAVGTKDEKGRALERLTGALWAKLGFRDVIYNAHATGEEIDVEGTHVLSGQILKAQCKAHSETVKSDDVRLFFGDVEKQRGRQPLTVGIFVSLSGYNGTSVKWYRELTPEQQTYFKTLDGRQLLEHLVAAELVISPDALLVKLQQLTRLEAVSMTVVVSERGAFWLLSMSERSTNKTYHCLLDGLGHNARVEDVEYLSTRIKTGFDRDSLITFRGRQEVISVLLKKGQASAAEICAETLQTSADVSSSIGTLQGEGLVRFESDSLQLRLDVAPYLQIAAMCIGSSLEKTFMTSDFHVNALQDIVRALIEARFRLALTPSEFDVIRKILLLSPGAVEHVTAGDTTSYLNFSECVKSLSPSPEELDRHGRSSCEKLTSQLVMALLADQQRGRVNAAQEKHKIMLSKLRIELKLAQQQSAFLQVRSDSTMVMAELSAGESIKAGQIAFAGAGLFFNVAYALMMVGEYDEAAGMFARVIREFPLSDCAKASTNNLGNCYLAKGRFEDALVQFERALDSELTRRNAMQNMVRAYALLGRSDMARTTFEMYAAEFAAEAETLTQLRALCSQASATGATTAAESLDSVEGGGTESLPANQRAEDVLSTN